MLCSLKTSIHAARQFTDAFQSAVRPKTTFSPVSTKGHLFLMCCTYVKVSVVGSAQYVHERYVVYSGLIVAPLL